MSNRRRSIPRTSQVYPLNRKEVPVEVRLAGEKWLTSLRSKYAPLEVKGFCYTHTKSNYWRLLLSIHEINCAGYYCPPKFDTRKGYFRMDSRFVTRFLSRSRKSPFFLTTAKRYLTEVSRKARVQSMEYLNVN